jgi:hypothetical protein
MPELEVPEPDFTPTKPTYSCKVDLNTDYFGVQR